jgi:thiol-disulfide isomerase/thioredoxin
MKKITLLLTLFLISLQGFAQLANGSTAPDFTATDINGVQHHLADYLAAGKTVIIDISATWCGPCWAYHNTKALDDAYAAYGPNGSDEIVVLFVEGDNATTLDDLHGTGTNTQGDWVGDSNYPIIDSGAIASLYQITYFPTVYRICPNGITTEIGAASATSIRNGINSAAGCGVGTITGEQNFVKIQDSQVGICATTGSPSVKLKNYGTNAVTAAVVNLLENGNVVATKTTTGSFSQFVNKTLIFDSMNINPASTYTTQIVTVNTVPNFNPLYSNGAMNFDFSTETTQDIELRVYTDNYPTEISWRIKNSANAIVASGGPYVGSANGGGADANTTKVHNISLPAQGECYTIELLDSYGDGWSLGNTAHGVEVFSNGVSVYDLPVASFGTLLTKSNALRTQTLGTNDFSEDKFTVYPNPSTGIIHFATEEAINVEIVDITGKVVYTAKDITNQTSVDLSSLQRGVYFAKITGQNASETKKIVLE